MAVLLWFSVAFLFWFFGAVSFWFFVAVLFWFSVAVNHWLSVVVLLWRFYLFFSLWRFSLGLFLIAVFSKPSYAYMILENIHLCYIANSDILLTVSNLSIINISPW